MRKAPETKVCSNIKCPKEQPLPNEAFTKGYARCQDCLKEQAKEYRQNNKEVIRIKKKQYYEENKKSILENKKKHYEENKEIISVRQKEYYEKNREILLLKSKEYNQDNKENIRIKDKKYRETNKEVIRIKRRERQKERRKQDPVFRLRQRISNSILVAIKNNGGVKKGSIWKYLSYTLQDLKDHLEALFEPWMTWSNHGKYNPETHDTNPTWQLDHIIPHSTFKYKSMKSKAFRDCWALSNLRPLDAKQNNLDGATKIRHKK